MEGRDPHSELVDVEEPVLPQMGQILGNRFYNRDQANRFATRH